MYVPLGTKKLLIYGCVEVFGMNISVYIQIDQNSYFSDKTDVNRGQNKIYYFINSELMNSSGKKKVKIYVETDQRCSAYYDIPIIAAGLFLRVRDNLFRPFQYGL